MNFLLSFSGVSEISSFKTPEPNTVQEMKPRIQQRVNSVPGEMLQRVMDDICKRLTECLELNGGHLNEVIFGK
jgi:hypothetical protein